MKDRLKEYLKQGQLLQLATVGNDEPWISTVYYVADDSLNVYWLSLPSRLHSKQLATHNVAAGAVVVKPTRPVIGLQLKGTVAIEKNSKIVKTVMDTYIQKYDDGHSFYKNFMTGVNQHTMYVLKPRLIVTFDEVHSKDTPRQEWRIVKGEVLI